MEGLSKKLAAVEAAIGRGVWLDNDFVGIRIDETGKLLTLVVQSAGRATSLEAELRQNTALAAVLASESLNMQVIAEPPPTITAIAAGTAGYGQGLAGYGTLGWFIYLDQVLVAISNHHVLCANGDATPICTPVYSGNGARIGRLHAFDNLSIASPRLFDFALAAIDDASLVLPQFAQCESGSTYPYPMRLGLSENLTQSQTYYTVGARPPRCAEGRFRGLTTSKVGPYSNGRHYVFTDQLLFDPITAPGDSGSIVVDRQTNRVLGLVFAGLEGVRSLANPLYRKGWTYSGSRALDDFEIPSFETTSSRPLSAEANTMADFPSQEEPKLPPIFQAGRAFRSWSSFAALQESIQRGGSNTWVESATVIQPQGICLNP